MLSIIDDVCAILIMAIFYGGYLSTMSFVVVGPAAFGTFSFKFSRHNIKACYVIFFGIILRMSVLKSGVNATLAGIAWRYFSYRLRQIELDVKIDQARLACLVAFFVLSAYALASADIRLKGARL